MGFTDISDDGGWDCIGFVLFFMQHSYNLYMILLFFLNFTDDYMIEYIMFIFLITKQHPSGTFPFGFDFDLSLALTVHDIISIVMLSSVTVDHNFIGN